MDGWIKLHRSIDEWEWRSEPNTLSVWLYILTHARHEAGSWKGTKLAAGQLVTGRDVIAHKTGVTVRSVRTALERLKTSNAITIETTNKGSVITVVNWEKYQTQSNQNDQQNDQQNDRKATSKRPANDQQTTTNKNEKNEINENNRRRGNGGDELLHISDTLNAAFDAAEGIGLKGGAAVERANRLAADYSAAWLLEAIRRASNAPKDAWSWRYIEGILRRWKQQGGIDSEKKSEQPAKPKTRRERYNCVVNGEVVEYEREVPV